MRTLLIGIAVAAAAAALGVGAAYGGSAVMKTYRDQNAAAVQTLRPGECPETNNDSQFERMRDRMQGRMQDRMNFFREDGSGTNNPRR